MRITQWGEYATQFCIYIAQQTPKTVSASDIAGSVGVDQLYAQQILQRLRKGDIIRSVRGAQGGYALVKHPNDISLKDIIIAAEGDTFEPICDSKPIDENKCSSSAQCGLRDVWYELREHIDKFLASKSLQSLIDKESVLVKINPLPAIHSSCHQ